MSFNDRFESYLADKEPRTQLEFFLLMLAAVLIVFDIKGFYCFHYKKWHAGMKTTENFYFYINIDCSNL